MLIHQCIEVPHIVVHDQDHRIWGLDVKTLSPLREIAGSDLLINFQGPLIHFLETIDLRHHQSSAVVI